MMVCGVFGVFVVVVGVVVLWVCLCVFVVFVRTSHVLLYSLPLSEKNSVRQDVLEYDPRRECQP